MADSDDLRSLRNYYYLGLYKNVIEESKNFDSPGAKVFQFRAMLEMKPELVFTQVNGKSSTSLQAIKLLATYRSAADAEKELAFETMAEWLGDEILKDDPTLQLLAAQMYFEEGNYKDALKLVANAGEDMEKTAMQVQVYLKIDRMDLALKAAKNMADLDDDDVLSQLANSWVHIAQGGDKITEASCLLQELVDKFGQSPAVLTSQAVCQMHLGNLMEANTHLKSARGQALQMGGKAAAATLVNYIVVLEMLKKPRDIIEKIVGELRENYPSHAWLATQGEMSDMFDRHAKTYAA